MYQRLSLIVAFFALCFFFISASSTHAAVGKWGGTVQTGDTGCWVGTFNSCYDPKASCEDITQEGPNSGTCVLDPSPNRSVCKGYANNDPTKTVQQGICYFSKDSSLASCSDMTASDYHQDPHYHHISDDVQNCPPNGGGTYQCCASDDPAKSGAATPIPPNPCPSDNGVCKSIPTALGTIDVTGPGAFIKTIFALLLSLSGGIAMLLIIISGYRIMTAQGDPEKVKGAREMLTSAIIGLLFMIFSVSILQILGVDILHIPGFLK